MSTRAKNNKPADNFDFLPGPNLCSQVGQNVSIVLRAALLEKCKLHGGQLSHADIHHVFELVMDSQDLFPIYQESHTTCTSIKTSTQFTQVGANKVMNFVVGAFCSDVIKELARTHRFQNNGWRRALIQGFADFFANKINTDLKEQLFTSYKKLVLQKGKSLTAVTISSSDDIIQTFAETISRVKATYPVDRRLATLVGSSVNNALTRKFGAGHSAAGWIDDDTMRSFLDQLFVPAPNNGFRQIVLRKIDGEVVPFEAPKETKTAKSNAFGNELGITRKAL